VNPFTQEDFPVRLLWGPRGAAIAADRGDILIVVDVLRFSSAVAAAVANGVTLIPVRSGEESAIATREGAILAISSQTAKPGDFSLSAQSYECAEPGTRVVISSANGATCARIADQVPYLLAASLLNASAVFKAVNVLMHETGLKVSVLACGERWLDSSEEGALRFAIEDYLGAGAVLSGLQKSMSPEAEVCRAAYEASRNNLRGVLWECESGRELRLKELGEDVDYCSALNSLEVVPVLEKGGFRDYRTA